MRDPARIPRVLEKLERLWVLWPDMRLGQLLHVIPVWEAGRPVDLDLFDLEDADLEEWIDRKLEKRSGPRLV